MHCCRVNWCIAYADIASWAGFMHFPLKQFYVILYIMIITWYIDNCVMACRMKSKDGAICRVWSDDDDGDSNFDIVTQIYICDVLPFYMDQHMWFCIIYFDMTCTFNQGHAGSHICVYLWSHFQAFLLPSFLNLCFLQLTFLNLYFLQLTLSFFAWIFTNLNEKQTLWRLSIKSILCKW